MMNASIEDVGVSGRHWIGAFGTPNYDLIMSALGGATKNIRIATFSLGYKSRELEKLFDVLQAKSSTGVPIQIIVNRLYDKDKHSDYARGMLEKMGAGRNFTRINFEPADEKENLHAKIFCIDGKIALVGSANMSKSGMFANHEIMIKIAGEEFVAAINDLLDRLAASVFRG